jgi:DNA replication initiation complex subunit (GINS family)
MTKKNKKPPIPDEVFRDLDEAIKALEKAVDKLKETRNNICG